MRRYLAQSFRQGFLKKLTAVLLTFLFLITPLMPASAQEGLPSIDVSFPLVESPVVADPIPADPYAEILEGILNDSFDKQTAEPTDELPTDLTPDVVENTTPRAEIPMPGTEEIPTVEAVEPKKDIEEEPQAMSSTLHGTVGNSGSWSSNDAAFRPHLPEVEQNTGALAYSYNITMPPGRNGLQPDLKLVYNNQVTENNSIMGYGWGLNIPYIERINKDGTDKLFTENYFSSSLTGELIASTTTVFISKVNNGEFLNYTFSSSTGWMVMDKGGTVYKFGSGGATRQDNASSTDQIFKWMLEEIRDTNNNFVKFEYTKDNGQIYPYRITYTGSGQTDGPFTVDFATSSRSDDTVSYKTGFRVKTNYRVTSITIYFNGSWVRKYEFAYIAGSNTERSLLSSIIESGRTENAETTVLPSLAFTYETGTSTWADGGISIVDPIEDITYGTEIVTDVNSDAWPDYIYSLDECASPPCNPDYSGVYISDGEQAVLDEDFALPVYFFRDETVGGIGGLYDQGARFLDFNGDNYADIIQARKANPGQGQFETKDAYIHDQVDNWVSSSTISSSIQILLGPNGNVAVTDMNGDGLPDLLYGAYSQLNSGAAFTASSTTWNPSVDTHGSNVRIADINIDGLSDIVITEVSGNHVYLNKGNGQWELETALNFPLGLGSTYAQIFADLNGDGLPDQTRKCEFGQAPVAYLNTGSGWVQKDEYVTPAVFNCSDIDSYTYFIDIDADGLQDKKAEVIKQGNVPDLLTQITFSQGGSTSVSYKSSAQYGLGSTLLNPKLPFVVQTVEELTFNDNNGTVWSESYTYEGGEYYFNGINERKFSGFGKVTKTDDVGNVSKTYFHQGNSSDSSYGEYNDHYSKIGKIYRVENYDNSNNLYSKTINKWDRQDLGNTASFVKLAQTVDSAYDGDSIHKDKSESYTYDGKGNVTEKIEWGEVTGSDDGTFSDTGSDKFTTTLTYAASSTAPTISLLSGDSTLDQSSNKVRENKYYYDGLSLGSVGKGNLTKQEMWKVSSTYVDIEKTYNSYGLVTQDKDPRDKTTTYTYDSQNLYPATVTQPHSLVSQYVYDYSSGKVATTTDQNGNIFVNLYDGLDRILETKQPNPSATSTLLTALSFAYTDTSGSVSITQTNNLDAGTAPKTYIYLDGLGRKIQQRKEAEGVNLAVTDYVYNNRGILLKESLPYFSAGLTKTTATTTTALYTNYLYDALKRVTSAVNAVGTTTTAYVDWKTTITDPRGKLKDLYSDAYGNLIQVDEHNSTSTYTTNYIYDYNKNLKKITDALGNVRNFTYDGLSRRLTAEDLHAVADGTYGSYTNTYDDSGNLTQKVDPKSQTVNYTYDDINRQLTEDYTGSAGTEVTYTYDSCTQGKGHLCTASSSAVYISNTYNALGQLASEQKTIDGTAYATSYTYDRQGNILTISNPDNSQVKYIYNSAGQTERVQRKEATDSEFTDVISSLDYSPTGQVTVQTNANGAVTTNTYDDTKLYRLTRKVTTVPDAESLMGGSSEYQVDNFENPSLAIPPEGEKEEESSTSTPKSLIEPSNPPKSAKPTTTPIAFKNQNPRLSFSNMLGSLVKGFKWIVGFITSPFAPKTAFAAAVELYDTPLFEDEDLTAYYRAEDANDSKGSRTLTNNGSTSFDSAKFNNGFNFGTGNTSKYMSRNDNYGITNGNITLSVWVKLNAEPGSSDTYELIFKEDASTDVNYGIQYYNNSGTYQLYFIRGKLPSTYQYVVANVSALGISSWHHIILTYDGTYINGYLDGEPVAAHVSASGNGSSAGVDKFSVGNRASDNSYFSNAIIDDGAVFSRALTGTEVYNLYSGSFSEGGDSSIIQDLSYTYDANGNITQIVDASPNHAAKTTTYVYDDLNRLTSASSTLASFGGNYLHTYTYDSIGNITNKSDVGSYTYSGSGYTNPHAVTSASSTSYTYDNNGNQTAAGTRTHTWDYNNRLTQISIPGSPTTTVTSTYDPWGQRLKQTVASSTTISTIYPTKYFNTNGTTTTRHIFANGEMVATVTYGTSTSSALPTELYSTPLFSDTNLIAYYRAENANDSKGSRGLTNTGSVAFNAAKFNNGFDFGSSNTTKYMSRSDAYGITNGSITLSVWVKLNSEPANGDTYEFIFKEDASTDVNYGVQYYNNSGTYQLYFLRGKLPSTFQYTVSNISALGTSNWHHIVFTYDGSNIVGYLDGSQLGSPASASGDGSSGGVDKFSIGGRATDAAYLQSGLSDDASVFNRALTSTEVSNLYNGTWPVATTTVYFIITDHLAGTNLVLNQEADVVQLVDYYPYGGSRLNEQSGGFDEKRKFTGQEFDSDTGLYYMNARYQNPTTGKFISQDPAFINLTHLNVQLSDPQSWNSYAYARNNPIVFMDPYGNMWTPWQSSGGFGNWMGNGGFLYNVYGSNVNSITTTAQNIQQNGWTSDNIMALGADAASITAKTSGVIVGGATAGMGAGVAVESGAVSTAGNALFNSQAAVRGGINATLNVGSQILSDKVEGKQSSLGDYAKIAGLSYVGGALINTKSTAINAGGFGGINAITQSVTGDHKINPVKVGGAVLGGGLSSWASGYLSTSNSLGMYGAQQFGLGRIGWSVETPISIISSGVKKK